MATLQVAEVVGDGVQVEVGELVVEPRHYVVAQVKVSQIEVDEILLFPGVHAILIEPEKQSLKVPAAP